MGALSGEPRPCMVDEDSAHQRGGDGKKVAAVTKTGAELLGHPEIGLVHERRRLERLRVPLTGELPAGDPLELFVEELDQAFGEAGVAGAPRAQERGDFALEELTRRIMAHGWKRFYDARQRSSTGAWPLRALFSAGSR